MDIFFTFLSGVTRLLHHEVEGRVAGLVEEVEELEVELVIRVLVGLMNKATINDNIEGDVRNVIVNNGQRGCSYMEFLACNPKEYDGKGGDIVYTHWIKKVESVQDMSGCGDNQKVKYTVGSFVGKVLTWWNSQIHTKSQKIAIGMAWEDFKTLMMYEFCPINEMQKNKNWVLESRHGRGWPCCIRGMVAATGPTTIQKVVQKAGALTDEAIRNGSLKKNPEKKGNSGETSRDKQSIDWLSKHKVDIVCHEKVVRIPLQKGKVLRVIGERLEEKELAFQTLKDKLCNAPVLALPDGPKDFVMYCDASGLGLGCVLMQRDLETLLVWNEERHIYRSQESPAYLQSEGTKHVSMSLDRVEPSDEPTEMQRGLDEQIEHKSDEAGFIPVVGNEKGYSCKWERITMNFVTKLPRTSSGHDAIWDIVDRLTKSAHFLPMRVDYKMDRLAMLYLNKIIARNDVLILIIFDRDSRFTSRFWQSMQEAPGTRLKAVRKCQKSYADKRRKPLEFSVGEYVLLKMSPRKGVLHFGKKGKLAPRFVGPFEITERIDLVAYRLRLPEELKGVHDTFHVSNLKKCLADPTLQIPLDEIHVDSKLNFVEETMEILEREFKKLKRSRITIVKVRWNSKQGPEFTWECKYQRKL
nr:retrotransposon protein, putative, Ty3-gypsy subclass [Tanacetum cinerariifolium]